MEPSSIWCVNIVKRCLINQQCFLPSFEMSEILSILLSFFCSLFLSLLSVTHIPHILCESYFLHISHIKSLGSVFFLSCRKAERRLSVLKRQKDECAFKEENTLHHMEAVLSVVEHISKERDQLLQMVTLTILLLLLTHYATSSCVFHIIIIDNSHLNKLQPNVSVLNM